MNEVLYNKCVYCMRSQLLMLVTYLLTNYNDYCITLEYFGVHETDGLVFVCLSSLKKI